MGFFESAKMFANQAVDSTRYAAQKTKLRSNIKSEDNNIERQYTEIGRYYFNKYVNNPDPEVAQFYDNAKRSMDAIYRHNQEIARIESMEAAMNQGGNQQYAQPNMQQGFNQNNMGGMQPNPQGFNQNNMGSMQPNPQGFNQNNMGSMQPNPQGFNQNNMGSMQPNPQGFNQNNMGSMQPNPQGFNQNIQGGVTPAEPQNIAPVASQADNSPEQ